MVNAGIITIIYMQWNIPHLFTFQEGSAPGTTTYFTQWENTTTIISACPPLCYNFLRFSKVMEDVHFSCKIYTIFTIFYGAYCLPAASGFCGVNTFRKTRMVLSTMRAMMLMMMMTRLKYVNPENTKHPNILYQKSCQSFQNIARYVKPMWKMFMRSSSSS